MNPFQYTARDYDPETRLRYYRERYYDSNIGRFGNEDPLTFDGGINFYTYVDNNPTNFVDPYGLCPAPPNRLEQQRQKGVADCIRWIYHIETKLFIPAAPGQDGIFQGTDGKGDISVENDVASYTRFLLILKARDFRSRWLHSPVNSTQSNELYRK